MASLVGLYNNYYIRVINNKNNSVEGNTYREQGRRTRVRIKTTPKEGIYGIDNINRIIKANSLYPFL